MGHAVGYGSGGFVQRPVFLKFMPGGRRVRGSVLVDNGRVVARGKTAFADLFKQCLFVLAEPKCEIFVGKAHPQDIFLLAQGKALQPGFPGQSRMARQYIPQ